MNEFDLFHRINDLSGEEERLYGTAGGGDGLSSDERARLNEIRVELDRCYDLLHQRQARINAGQNPGEAKPRPAEVVENYEQ